MKVQGAVNVNIAGASVEKSVGVLLVNTYADSRDNRLFSMSINVPLTEEEYYKLVHAELGSREVTSK